MSEQVARRSREFFEDIGYYCAESVLLAVAESRGIESDILPQVATGFCSGMARTCGMCGAVSGAIMGIGLITGVRQPRDDRTATYAAVQKFLAAFTARFGSINCQELTGCDLSTPEGLARFEAENVFARCLEFVETATRLALAAVGETGS